MMKDNDTFFWKAELWLLARGITILYVTVFEVHTIGAKLYYPVYGVAYRIRNASIPL